MRRERLRGYMKEDALLDEMRALQGLVRKGK